MNDSRSFEPSPTPSPSILDAAPELFGLTEETDGKQFRRALIGAVVFHLVLLVAYLPSFADEPLPEPPKRKVYAVQSVRFKPPKAVQQEAIPERRAKRIPIPDPTPDEPEPIQLDELPELDLDLPEVADVVFGIPDAPPGPAMSGSGPLQVAGDVLAPAKVFSPQPRYTEEARKARVQGVVILQAVIDSLGNVADIKVLKGLSMGLSDKAVEAVREWKYRPATLDGDPVPVYVSIMVHFSLQ